MFVGFKGDFVDSHRDLVNEDYLEQVQSEIEIFDTFAGLQYEPVYICLLQICTVTLCGFKSSLVIHQLKDRIQKYSFATHLIQSDSLKPSIENNGVDELLIFRYPNYVFHLSSNYFQLDFYNILFIISIVR